MKAFTNNSQSLRPFVIGVIASLVCGLITPVPAAARGVLDLPEPGTVVTLSEPYTPAMVMGISLYPENPLKFDFIVDAGDSGLQGPDLELESNKLIKYFLAALTIPEDEMWVNLSPYEKDRIIPPAFGQTVMGRDLLALDYMLKQLSSSLMHPDQQLGNAFWERVYKKAQQRFGTTAIPINTFNKIWIVPEQATVYEHAQGAFIVHSHLKVMLEEDYLALEANQEASKHGVGIVPKSDRDVISGVSGEIVREILIPEIEQEINNGTTFANLRQIYHSMLLAAWYKNALREGLLGQLYVNQKKTLGVEVDDKDINNKIYEQYVDSFKEGVFNFIKEDVNPQTKEVIPRKYFSGGVELNGDQAIMSSDDASQRMAVRQQVMAAASRLATGVRMTVGLTSTGVDTAAGEQMTYESALSMGLAEAVTPGETDMLSKEFKAWFDETLGFMVVRNNLLYSFLDGDDRFAMETYLKSLDNDVQYIYEARGFLKPAEDDGRRKLLELGSGDTKLAVGIAAANQSMDVVATDVWDSNQETALPKYLPDAQDFEEELLAAQTSSLKNVTAVRAQADIIGHLPEGSLDYILLVNPARATIRELIVMIREFNLSAKLRPGGQIIIKADSSLADYFSLVDDKFQFQAIEGHEMFGIDLHTAAAWKDDIFKGKVYVGQSLEDAIVEMFDVTLGEYVSVGKDSAVLAHIHELADKFQLERVIVEGIMANHVNVEQFIQRITVAIQLRNPFTRMREEDVRKYLEEKELIQGNALSVGALADSITIEEERQLPGIPSIPYTIDGEEYEAILMGSVESAELAAHVVRVREAQGDIQEAAAAQKGFLQVLGPEAVEYYGQLDVDDRMRVDFMVQRESLSFAQAVTWILGEREIEERQRVAIHSMDHNASALVDPFVKLTSLGTALGYPTSSEQLTEGQRNMFSGLLEDIDALHQAFLSYAKFEPPKANFNYMRIFDFEARWRKIEARIKDSLKLLRKLAETEGSEQEIYQFIYDSAISLVKEINLDLGGQIAFAQGDRGFNRQSINVADALREALAGVNERRHFPQGYVQLDIDVDAELGQATMNPRYIGLVITNLVNNAHDEIKKKVAAGQREEYQPGAIRIRLDYDEATNNLAMSVHDTAGGIDPASSLMEQRLGRLRIFEYGHTTGKKGGTGVGLAEVYHISRLMSWDLELNPMKEVNGTGAFGAEFTLKMPFVSVQSDGAVMAVQKKMSQRPEEVGGIDLNADMVEWQIERNEASPLLRMRRSISANVQVDGFVPVIINTVPIHNVSVLLGLE